MASCAAPFRPIGCRPRSSSSDIGNVTALGVEIATNSPVKDLGALHADGYEAVLLATGTARSTGLKVPGDDLDGVLAGTDFLCSVKLGRRR